MNSHTGYVPPRRDFIGKPAPPGYVAGIGRGATGFTTRSDIGPAREAAASHGDGAAGPSKRPPGNKRSNNDDEEDYDLNETNYDEFAGYGGALFNKAPYEKDDEEADKIYEAIDKHQDERGKALREAKSRKELEELRTKRPKIQQQFSDLKPSLREVSEEEWMNIPDVGDARNRKQRVARQDKFTPVPDSLLAHQAKLISGGEKLVYIDPKAMDSIDDDDDDDGGNDDAAKLIEASRNRVAPQFDTSLTIGEMSEVRSSYMSMQLSRVSNTSGVSSDKPATNAQDYLTNLQSMIPNQITDSTTLNEYRKQFASLRATNPTFQNAWIASVRLEEAAGKLKAARALILAGCEQCPKSADLWLEAIRLHPSDMSKALIVRALKEVPRSVKLWVKAAELESNDEARRQVYAKARKLVPKSVLIWKKSVELEPKREQAKLILSEAVECCPEAVELWLALAKLEPYEEANKVLVRAAERNPTERSIWITAAKLQEHVGNLTLVESLIKRSIEELAEKGVEIKRDEWLKEAIDADSSGFKVTCAAIIKRVIGRNLAHESAAQRLKLLLDDVERFSAEGSIECARAVFKSIVGDREFCKQESVWLKYVEFEKRHKRQAAAAAAEADESSPAGLLRLAVAQHCPKSETLWLMLADECSAKLDECRQVLADALDANPDSEKVVIKAVELERANGNHQEARRILADACSSAKTAQLVMRSAELEWELGNLEEVEQLLRRAVEEYKNFPGFYLKFGKLEERRNEIEKAKVCYSNGLKFNPTSVELWTCLARLEEQSGFVAKARSRLEMARLRNPKRVELWLEAVELELRVFEAKQAAGAAGGPRQNRPDVAMTLLARGIRECKDCPDVDKLIGLQRKLG